MRRTRICRLPSTPPVNASDLPSGEIAGDSSRPAMFVRRVTRASAGAIATGFSSLARSFQRRDRANTIPSVSHKRREIDLFEADRTDWLGVSTTGVSEDSGAE